MTALLAAPLAALLALSPAAPPKAAPAPAGAAAEEGPDAGSTPAVAEPSAEPLDPALLDRQRRAAIGLLVGAGAANVLAFGLRGLHFWFVSQRCAPAPGAADGELPADTQCPPLAAFTLLSNAYSIPNIGLFLMTREGARTLGRQRADRVKLGLARPIRAARRMEILTPLTYFSAVGVVTLGFLVFYDNATNPAGTSLRDAPTRQPAFNPYLHFGLQTAMTATAVGLAIYLHDREYSRRAKDLELTPIGGPIPGGATLGIGGRF
ncbi:MAG: hypothetical protein R3A79_24420 [Nannocystaceae bacterium]